MRRLTALAAATAALCALPAGAALGDDDQYVQPDGDGGIDYGIELGPDTTYTPPQGDDYDENGYVPTDPDGGTDPLTPLDELENAQDPGVLYCMIFPCETPVQPLDNSPDEQAPPPVNPADLGQIVLDHMDLPAPDISIAPTPPRPTLVQLWTWFWVPPGQWQPHSDSISLGGATVTVKIEPESVAWQTGEGTTVCDGPGEEWTPGSDAETSSCGHEYAHTTVDEPGGKYTVSATIKWHASWTCEGRCIATEGDFGTLDSDSSSARLEVRQRQSLVIE